MTRNYRQLPVEGGFQLIASKKKKKRERERESKREMMIIMMKLSVLQPQGIESAHNLTSRKANHP